MQLEYNSGARLNVSYKTSMLGIQLKYLKGRKKALKQ